MNHLETTKQNPAQSLSAVRYLTERQAQLIIRLLNTACFTRHDKTKVLLSLMRLTPERAEHTIDQLSEQITAQGHALPAGLAEQRAQIAAEVAALHRPDLDQAA